MPIVKKKNNKQIVKHKNKQDENKEIPLITRLMQDGLNHLFFYDSVSRESVDELIRDLMTIQNHTYGSDIMTGEQINAKPTAIVLHIHSYGGEVYAGLEALHAIEACTTIPVHTVVDGIAASAATWLAIAGKRRYITKHGHMLIHEVISGQNGEIKWSDTKTNYKSLKTIMKTIKDIYTARTPIKAKDLDAILSRDLYWDAMQCKKYLGMNIL